MECYRELQRRFGPPAVHARPPAARDGCRSFTHRAAHPPRRRCRPPHPPCPVRSRRAPGAAHRLPDASCRPSACPGVPPPALPSAHARLLAVCRPTPAGEPPGRRSSLRRPDPPGGVVPGSRYPLLERHIPFSNAPVTDASGAGVPSPSALTGVRRRRPGRRGRSRRPRRPAGGAFQRRRPRRAPVPRGRAGCPAAGRGSPGSRARGRRRR